MGLALLLSGCATSSDDDEELAADSSEDLRDSSQEAFDRMDGLLTDPDSPEGQLKAGDKGLHALSPDQVSWSSEQILPRLLVPDERHANVLAGHDYWVNSVAFAPDGQTLASGSWDKKIKLWDPETGEVLQTLSGHDGWVYSVAISPDGQLLASGSSDNTIGFWSTETGELLQKVAAHDDSVAAVAFSSDGKFLASGGFDDELNLWDLETGESPRVLSGHDQSVYAVSFSADSSLLASGSSDSTVKIWDAESGEELHTLSGHEGEVFAVAFSPDDEVLASAGRSSIRLWDVETGDQLHTLSEHEGWVSSLEFSPYGRILASGGADNTVRLWDAVTGDQLHTFSGHEEMVRSVAFAPDDEILASASRDNTVKLWSADGIKGPTAYDSEGFELIQERAEDLFSSAKERDLLPGSLQERQEEVAQQQQQIEQTRPEPPETEQGEFETTEEYRDRVEGLRDEYQQEVREWEERVEQLNRSQAELRQDLQSYYRDQLWPRILHYSFLEAFGEPVYEEVSYDADQARFIVEVTASSELAGDWSQTLELPKEFSSPEERRERGPEFRDSLRDAEPEVTFSISQQGIEWEDAQVEVQGESYAMNAADDAAPERLHFAMDDVSGDVELAAETEVDTDAPVWEWDTPETERADGSEKAQWQDDLPDMIAEADSAESDSNVYLFAVGIENYRQAPDVPFAERSTELFRDLAHHKLGVPDSSRHISVVTGRDATIGTIDSDLEQMLRRIDEDDTLIFYYAGHGVPDREGSDAYLLAHDGNPATYDRFDHLALEHIYQRLEESNAKRVIGFIDACFSGQANPDQYIFEGVAPAGRMVREEESIGRLPDNMTVLTAGTNEQFANAYFERQHRLFSYYLIRGMVEDKKGDELYEYVKGKVEDRSYELGRAYHQTPQMFGNVSLEW
ncbi:caspase family protein [Halorhodospira halochloris]|uniref:WD40 domain-containing protein n=1 Tax=Halorhodospira halochloris TaxID=1052 RepID=UPI001EE93022|nr:caspase family protein [Halorhodospira halochloris]MCG5547534.1 caspase family protein [Halorhodospira halochloris]